MAINANEAGQGHIADIGRGTRLRLWGVYCIRAAELLADGGRRVLGDLEQFRREVFCHNRLVDSDEHRVAHPALDVSGEECASKREEVRVTGADIARAYRQQPAILGVNAGLASFSRSPKMVSKRMHRLPPGPSAMERIISS